MLLGRRARGESDGAQGEAVVSVSFHSEQVFSGPFHRPSFSKRNVSCPTLPLSLLQHIIMIHEWGITFTSLILKLSSKGLFLINSSSRSKSAVAMASSAFKTHISTAVSSCTNVYELHSLVKALTGKFQLYDLEVFCVFNQNPNSLCKT